MNIEALIEQIENTDWLSQAEHILEISQLQIEWDWLPSSRDQPDPLGVQMDSPELVAGELYNFLQRDQQSYQVGYPEKIFVKVNQLLPHVVSGSIEKNISTIQHYAKSCNET